MEDLDLIREFVIESTENLGRLDYEIVALERGPHPELLASLFRTIHTIKGTCGFFGFSALESITHHAEDILSRLRIGQPELSQTLVPLVLETVDAVKTELASIEATARESGASYHHLIERHKLAFQQTPPAPPALTRTNGTPSNNASFAASTIRVDVRQLDTLAQLVGELILARNRLHADHPDLRLNAASRRLDLITTGLQEAVVRIRTQPIAILWNQLPRLVRNLSAACGKQIALKMQGAETELDKTIIEALRDPLTHLVRNACDHGIEPPAVRATAGKPIRGILLLRAFHEGGSVILEISDDGAGIDPLKVKQTALQNGLLPSEQVERLRNHELVNLVFLPGFSTAAQVSSISGRGVGMDVVKTHIEQIGGFVNLASRPGHGTTVQIRIPLSPPTIPERVSLQTTPVLDYHLLKAFSEV